MRAVPGARRPDIQIKLHRPAEVRRGGLHRVDDGSADAFSRVHFTVWGVHDAMHRAKVTLVPPALVAIFKAVDTHPWIDHRTGYQPVTSGRVEGGRWGKVKVCEGDEFCTMRWKEMSLAKVSARVRWGRRV